MSGGRLAVGKIGEGQPEKNGLQHGQELRLDLLDRSLHKKIPVQAGASSIFYTTRLCQRLVQSKSEFDLSDPNGYLLSSEYNSLHDPNLRRYLYRKDVHQRLTAGGFITKDDRVVCSLREMNRYKQHLMEVERDWTRKLQIEKEDFVAHRIKGCTQVKQQKDAKSTNIRRHQEVISDLY
ncbi:fibrous sheath-interacting protein 2 [Pygocentrus nattereri]|uniref:fibrous sheath-interacting protein 2 n=1 Tax=Pygocentrus nattereri TaxID=42514 RepID=UPI001890D7FB|nr:fibrous sheath-interacting protein 2 [Pygocentrus nattereri]